MAEQVQFRLEAQVPELEDLERKGLFSPREIRAIVKRRTRLEYALERRISRKEDYLRYIEYEVNLEALRRARKDKLFVGKTYKLSLSDYSGLRRIQNVFDRATRTFAGDTALWLQAPKPPACFALLVYCYCLLAPRITSRAIQKLPTNPTLWVLAANHELHVNNNTTAARGLFQRGLRLCDDSQELWAAYHLMEVEYTEKIRERRKVLGIGAEQRKQNNESVKEAENAGDPEEDNAFDGDVIKLPELLQGEVAAFREDDDAEQPAKKRRRTERELVTGVAEALSNEDDSNLFLNGAVAVVVYNAAIGKIPSDLEFRKRLLKNYAPFVPESPAAEAGRKEGYESLRRDFADSADARGLIACRHLVAKKPGTLEWLAAVRETSAEFAQAVNDFDTSEMHDVRCAFLRDVLEEGRKEPETRKYLSKMLSNAYAEALKSGKASSD
ncbi:MAG: U3 small nucleolar RNA-associated protein 6-domain-containing protein, partial [Olpidium bornovanus]